MDAKQKSLLVLTVAALGFLGYQIFQLVDRDITETPVIAEQQPIKAPLHHSTTAMTALQTASKPAAILAVPSGRSWAAKVGFPTTIRRSPRNTWGAARPMPP